ncbi:type II toxin-antitoxin system VapC family toxin [Phenylobacterium aquaticum]|uniref:type II toxin-antitoxin system VapC family toxin n=1 Tax=Phenylobacterium aquaticum TaxID=1763816 RepID=UPI001F5CEE58|nr:type II toxin-antitoxin system VapC family toxin [Phenylobacterium aquaticum]
MICIDSSALLAVLLDEPEADACAAILGRDGPFIISAATLAEVLIVADGRGLGDEMSRLVEGLRLQVIDLDQPAAIRVAQAYRRWGKGRHPARLNYGDCFAYALAAHLDCPLLFVGDDFAKTDLKSAL